MNILRHPAVIIVLILLVVLLFGSRRLPDLARSIGQSLKIFKREVKELKDDDGTSEPGHTGAGTSTTTTSTTTTTNGVPGATPGVGTPGSTTTPGTTTPNGTASPQVPGLSDPQHPRA